jgi:hypothetical protein
MKTKKYIIAFLSISIFLGFTSRPISNQASDTPRKIKSERPFKTGEKLTYILHYGIFNAGIAEIAVSQTEKPLFGRDTIFNMIGKGRTTGAADLIFKVRDHYETFVDVETMQPLKFIRRVDEGGYKISQDYVFNIDSNKVMTQDDKSFDVPEGVQDMISAFYFARTIDFKNAKIDDVFEIPAFVDNEIFYLKIKFAGRKTIKLRSGKYRCLKFNPIVQEGRIFKTDEDLIVWISDDKNKIPILAESKILVGSIKMELSEYEGLAHEIAKVEK